MPTERTRPTFTQLADLGRGARAAFAVGQRDQMVDHLLEGVDLPALPEVARLRDVIDLLGSLAIELRRENVATLGTHDAFVRHTAAGSLHQVIRPVTLSQDAGHLYQILVNRPFWKTDGEPDTGKPYRGRNANDESNVGWAKVPADGGPANAAHLTYPGLVAINAVAGCQIITPPHVVVDGERRLNPYVQRAEGRRGRPGDIVRVVVAVAIAGLAPATGNPIGINYTLDYDPARDLQHLLAKIAGDSAPCFLQNEEHYESRPGTAFVPLYGGVGYEIDLRDPDVRRAYSDFTGILQNAVKKAQTVAKRNAMRSHPALGGISRVMMTNGRAVVPVVGWAGDQQGMAGWMKLATKLATGDELGELADSMETHMENYDPERHDAADRDQAHVIEADGEAELSPEQLERNTLIAYIDQGLMLLSHGDAAGLGYEPATDSTERLKEIKAELEKLVRADDAG